jgi:hypothetical protein
MTIRPAPFTISDAALRHIEWMRAQCAEEFPDNPPAMAGVGLGQRVLKEGGLDDYSVLIGFWSKSKFSDSGYELVQRVSGLDLVFPVPDWQVPLFEGKEIDYAPDRAFYLRDRPA